MVEQGGHVTYRVAWFDGRRRHPEWPEASEVTAHNPALLSTGFERTP
jgi:hypothetical protein